MHDEIDFTLLVRCNHVLICLLVACKLICVASLNIRSDQQRFPSIKVAFSWILSNLCGKTARVRILVLQPSRLPQELWRYTFGT
jgi:ABC-type enterobactin transport system permease subunit